VKEQEAQVRAAKERLTELQQSDPALPVREATADLTAAESRARSAEYAVTECEVRAPTAGTVLRLQTSVGEVIGGTGTAAPILFCRIGHSWCGRTWNRNSSAGWRSARRLGRGRGEPGA